MEINKPKNAKLGSLKSMLIFLIGWILLYPVVKFGAEARIRHEVKESFFIYVHIIGSFVIILVGILTPFVNSIQFNHLEKRLIVKKSNLLNFKRVINIDYINLNYKVFNSFAVHQIQIFQDSKRKVKIEPAEFSKEEYEHIISELNKIKKEHFPVK